MKETTQNTTKEKGLSMPITATLRIINELQNLFAALFPPKMGPISGISDSIAYLERMERNKNHFPQGFVVTRVEKAKERRVLLLPGRTV